MNQETPTYYFRHKRRLEEDADGRRSSRFLGMNYLLLALFIGVSFYFFFPRLFQQKQSYAPESAVRECFAALHEVQAISGASIHEASDSTVTNTAVIKRLQEQMPTLLSHYDSKDEPFQLFVLDSQGQVLLNSETIPGHWAGVPAYVLQRRHGATIHRIKNKGTLLMFEEIRGTDLIVIVGKEFPPLFQSEEE